MRLDWITWERVIIAVLIVAMLVVELFGGGIGALLDWFISEAV